MNLLDGHLADVADPGVGYEPAQAFTGHAAQPFLLRHGLWCHQRHGNPLPGQRCCGFAADEARTDDDRGVGVNGGLPQPPRVGQRA